MDITNLLRPDRDRRSRWVDEFHCSLVYSAAGATALLVATRMAQRIYRRSPALVVFTFRNGIANRFGDDDSRNTNWALRSVTPCSTGGRAELRVAMRALS